MAGAVQDAPFTETLKRAADDYLRRGWSFIPVMGKKAGIKWRPYGTRQPTMKEAERWFNGKQNYTGIAVVFGEVSGGLACRDFDDAALWKHFYDHNPDLADTCPIVITDRGAHLYCRSKPGSLHAVRQILGCVDLKGPINITRGELRADMGCYSVAPPSIHPKSGKPYFWTHPELLNNIPVVDLRRFITRADRERAAARAEGPQSLATILKCHTAHAEDTSNVAVSAVPAVCQLSPPQESDSAGPLHRAQAAIATTLPIEAGQRNRLLFKFAQKLKAIPAYSKAKPDTVKEHVRTWHKFALPVITTKAWEETWSDFVIAWERIQHPAGEEPIHMIFNRAIAAPMPKCAVQYDSPEMKALVALCKQLQVEAGDKPFYLAGRKAAELVKADHRKVARWIKMLVVDKVISLETAGKRHKASEYRFIAE